MGVPVALALRSVIANGADEEFRRKESGDAYRWSASQVGHNISSVASVNGGDMWKLYTEAQDWLRGRSNGKAVTYLFV